MGGPALGGCFGNMAQGPAVTPEEVPWGRPAVRVLAAWRSAMAAAYAASPAAWRRALASFLRTISRLSGER